MTNPSKARRKRCSQCNQLLHVIDGSIERHNRPSAPFEECFVSDALQLEAGAREIKMEAKLRPRNAVLVASSIKVHCPHCDTAQPAPGGSEFCEPLEAKEMCDGSVSACVSCDAPIRMIWNNKVQVI